MARSDDTGFAEIGVLVGREHIGDALLKLPFVRTLRLAFPHARISWITSHGPTAYAGPLREITRPYIDACHVQPDFVPTRRRPEHAPAPCAFDLLLDTRNLWKEVRHARRIPHRVLVAMAARYLLSDRRPPLLRAIRRPRHLCDRLLEMIEVAAGRRCPPASGGIPVPEEAAEKARRVLPPGAVYVGIVPGVGNATKAWPRDRHVRVAHAQLARGRVPVFVLGPGEADWADALAREVPQALFPLQRADVWGGEGAALENTLAVGRRLRLAIASDCGAGHILAAVDCPLVSLFGPTDPAKLAPRVTHGVVLAAADFEAKSRAMRDIPVVAVERAVEALDARVDGVRAGR